MPAAMTGPFSPATGRTIFKLGAGAIAVPFQIGSIVHAAVCYGRFAGMATQSVMFPVAAGGAFCHDPALAEISTFDLESFAGIRQYPFRFLSH